MKKSREAASLIGRKLKRRDCVTPRATTSIDLGSIQSLSFADTKQESCVEIGRQISESYEDVSDDEQFQF